MKIRLRSLAAVSILGLILTACSSITASQPLSNVGVEQKQPAQTANSSAEDTNDVPIAPSEISDEGQMLKDGATPSLDMAFWPDGQVRVDQQGTVEIAMVPINLNDPQVTLDFEVSMNTHSVDLSMDLAALASLKTDSGLEVNASGWNGPSGGHHVSGILSFPSSINGEGVLDGVMVLELKVIDLDTPERIFIWER
ncbi:MAG: hypothetical protein SCH68_05125 [Brevefilum sp.]|nr:hypothetical protein [Brevefilum sp.]